MNKSTQFLTVMGVFMLVGAGCVREQPSAATTTATTSTPQVATSTMRTPGVFRPGLPISDFNRLTLSDLPGYEINSGYSEDVAVFKDRVVVSGAHNVYEYDTNGTLIATADPSLCERAMGLAQFQNFLFWACYGKAVYQIDMDTNQLVETYTPQNGLADFNNLNLAVSDDYVWVGTFSGLARINPFTHRVVFYTSELGAPSGSHLNVRAHVFNNQVWAKIIASASSPGGISLYHKDSNTWTFFGPTAFGQKERIDFDDIQSTPGGLYVLFGSENHRELRTFDVVLNTWSLVKKFPLRVGRFDAEYLKALPGGGQRTTPHVVTLSDKTWPNDKFWDIDFLQDGIIKRVPIHGRRYLAVSPQATNGAYYILSSIGLEKFTKDDLVPQVIREIPNSEMVIGDWNYFKVMLTPDEKYIIVLQQVNNEMDGSVNEIDVLISAIDTGLTFRKTVSSSDSTIPFVDDSLQLIGPDESGRYEITKSGKAWALIDVVRQKIERVKNKT